MLPLEIDSVGCSDVRLRQIQKYHHAVRDFAEPRELGNAWNAWQIQQHEEICEDDECGDGDCAHPSPPFLGPKRPSEDQREQAEDNCVDCVDVWSHGRAQPSLEGGGVGSGQHPNAKHQVYEAYEYLRCDQDEDADVPALVRGWGTGNLWSCQRVTCTYSGLTANVVFPKKRKRKGALCA